MTTTQIIASGWTLWFGPDKGSVPGSADEARQMGYTMIPASVPGNVELDLVAAGKEEDPLIHDHLTAFEKYEYYNWLYCAEFNADPPADRDAVLVLHGVNTFAAVRLNGQVVGDCGNMLIAHEFTVNGTLQPGKNTLAVSIRSAMNEARRYNYPVAWIGAENSYEMTHLRMPPHSFGWDIMPRLLSAGLWRPVTLQYRPRSRFTDVYLATTTLKDGQAHLQLSYSFISGELGPARWNVDITGRCGERTFAARQTTHFVSNSFGFTVEDPALWWPRGYGDQPLYDVTVVLSRNGTVLDRHDFRFGIRTAAVNAAFDRGADNHFGVLVNGRPIFIHGSNWVPLSALHSLDEGRTDRALTMAADCGCNALRCWGGNVYESDRFYGRCDELGLLIWQDFAIACTLPPQDDAFAAVMEREAACVIRRLRNHPCLLLWAGDNEVDMFYTRYPLGPARHNRVTREVLPRAVATHDPYRYYLPSSPYLPEGYLTDKDGPEQHLWGPRDDFKGDFYRRNTASFASEIGYHGCPAVSSLRRFIDADQLWPWQGSDQWRLHNAENPLYGRGYDRNDLMARQAALLVGAAPEGMENFAFASQLSQAEAKKFFIEQFRMHKGSKTGILWWNLIDGWPQTSDAVVDYYYHTKLAYHFITRVQRPVQLMVGEYDSWRHPVILVNDTFAPVAGTCRIWDADTGETLLIKDWNAPADGRIEVGQIAGNPSVQRMLLLSWTVGDDTWYSHYLAGRPPFDLAACRRWVTALAVLTPAFDAEDCWQ